MKNYEIVVDSSSDLNKEVRAKYGIYDDYMKGTLYLADGKEILADLDNEQFSQKDYYALVKKQVGSVRSAFQTQQEILRVLEPLAKKGVGAIVLTMSSGMSGTYNAVKTGVELLKEDYKDANIEVVDTLKYGGAIGLLAIYAAKNRDAGMSLEDNVKWLNENRYNLHESGPMDDLRFLAKVGRISAPKAFFGQLIGVQPLADFTRDGLNVPMGTVKGASKTDDIAMKYMQETIVNPGEQIIAIAESDREERAQKYKKLIEELFKPKEVIILPVSLTTGANVGPGLCTAFYLGKPLSEDRSVENDIFKRLTGK